jgi:hypothetical protein
VNAATRVFDLRHLAFRWRAQGHTPALDKAQVVAAAERHLQERHARVEHEPDGHSLRFGSGSGARRSWLGAIRGGQLHVDGSEGRIVLTVHAGVARTLVICALPAVVIGILGAWPLALMFGLVGAANLWFVDQGARRLIDAALGVEMSSATPAAQ